MRGDREMFSSVGLWEGFLGVKITHSPYLAKLLDIHTNGRELGNLPLPRKINDRSNHRILCDAVWLVMLYMDMCFGSLCR